MYKAMKKIYVTPETVNVGLMAEPVMNLTSGETGSTGVGGGNSDDEDPELSAGNRGDWGSIWK